jgi:hypothetical protein
VVSVFLDQRLSDTERRKALYAAYDDGTEAVSPETLVFTSDFALQR